MCIQDNICQSALQSCQSAYLDEFVQSEISKSSNIAEGQFQYISPMLMDLKSLLRLLPFQLTQQQVHPIHHMCVACKLQLQPLFFSLPNVKEAVSNQMNGKPVQAAFWPHYSKLLCGRGRAVFIHFSPVSCQVSLLSRNHGGSWRGRARWY